MELMDISLDKLNHLVHERSKERFDENVLGSIGVTVLKALNCLKQLSHIIHRGRLTILVVLILFTRLDVKPSNILLNTRGKIKICDFGISGYLIDSMAKTKEVGCRPYMAV